MSAAGSIGPVGFVGPVGFIGLGQIGAPMAKHLFGWEGGLVVFDVAAAACTSFADGGAQVARSPAEVAKACRVISVMVRDDDQVADVVLGADGLLVAAQPGTVIAIHSTIAPGTAERLAEEAAPHGVDVVDAPVSGGFMGAHAGNLAVMVGGPADAVERCRPVFERWAGLVAHLGPVGAGTKAKLARNLLHFVSFTATGEAARLAEEAGVDLTELAKVVRHSDAVTGGAGAVMLRPTTAPLAPSDGLHDIFVHTRELGEKDLRLALALGESLGLDLPLGRLALARLGDALGVPHDSAPEGE